MNQLLKKRKCKEVDQSSPWPHLLPEILTSIAGNSLQDKLRLRAVCSPWRRAISLPENNKGIISHLLPLKAPLQPDPTLTVGKVTFTSYESCFLIAAAVYLIQPLNNVGFLPGWLLTVDEVSPGILSVRDGLKKTSLGYLPNDFPYEINLLDYRVTQISMMGSLTFINSGELPSTPRVMSIQYKKVVFIRNSTCNLSSSPSYCFAVVLFGCGKAAALNLGTLEWKTVHDGKGSKLDDIVSYKGQLYGINKRGKAFCFAYDTWEMNVVAPPTYGGLSRRKRLAECNDNLYIIVRDVELSVSNGGSMPMCKVYRLNEEKHIWVNTNNLDNHILIIGVDDSFLVSAKYFPGCEGNCILFQDNSFTYHYHVSYVRRVLSSEDILVFNMNNSSRSGIIHTSSLCSSRSIEEVANLAKQVIRAYKLNVLSHIENDETTYQGMEVILTRDIQDTLNKISNMIKEVGRRHKRSDPPYHSRIQDNIVSRDQYNHFKDFVTSLSRALAELAK